MPEPLWQCADYLKYADHKSPLVREWALDGLEYHYPGQGLPVALKLLGDPEEDVFEKRLSTWRSMPPKRSALFFWKPLSPGRPKPGRYI